MDDWKKRAAANPYGLADYRAITGNATVRELEQNYLPQSAQRDYASAKKAPKS
jgi:hypothetical protein